MNILSIYLVHRIGNMFGYYIGCIAAMLMMLDLTMLYFTNNYYFPDTMFSFWVTLFIFYLVKFVKIEKSYRNILLCGLFLGVASLTKPVAYLLVIPVSLYLFVFLTPIFALALTVISI